MDCFVAALLAMTEGVRTEALLPAADTMLAAGSGYDVCNVRSFGKGTIMAIKGSCHCGNTQFEVSEAPTGVTRCTCSLCSKRGAPWAYYTPAQFRLTSPAEK